MTNAKDDPLQLAADAATAGGLGLRRDRNHHACLAQRLSQCAGLRRGRCRGPLGHAVPVFERGGRGTAIGMAGFSSYAETRLRLWHEKHLHRRRRYAVVQGPSSPRPMPSRGIKMRCTSGAGSELLMGVSMNRKSLLYLEARCLCLQRGMGVSGHANGGIDGAPLTATVPAAPQTDGGEPLLLPYGSPMNAPAATTRVRRNRKSASAPDQALSRGGLGPDLFRHGLDPQIRQLLQSLASQRRGTGGLSRLQRVFGVPRPMAD